MARCWVREADLEARRAAPLAAPAHALRAGARKAASCSGETVRCRRADAVARRARTRPPSTRCSSKAVRRAVGVAMEEQQAPWAAPRSRARRRRAARRAPGRGRRRRAARSRSRPARASAAAQRVGEGEARQVVDEGQHLARVRVAGRRAPPSAARVTRPPRSRTASSDWNMRVAAPEAGTNLQQPAGAPPRARRPPARPRAAASPSARIPSPTRARPIEPGRRRRLGEQPQLPLDFLRPRCPARRAAPDRPRSSIAL